VPSAANQSRWGNVDVLGRLRYDPRTRAYAERRTHEGLSKPEIIRCLKRYVAREIFNALPILVAENTSTHPLAKPQEHRPGFGTAAVDGGTPSSQ
jgi:hypothetical protein